MKRLHSIQLDKLFISDLSNAEEQFCGKIEKRPKFLPENLGLFHVFYNLKELFKETILLNTAFSAVVVLGSTLKYPCLKN